MLSKNNNRLSKISRITKNNTMNNILGYNKSLVCKYLLISIPMPNSINLFQIKKGHLHPKGVQYLLNKNYTIIVLKLPF